MCQTGCCSACRYSYRADESLSGQACKGIVVLQHRYEYLHPKQTSIGKRVPEADEGCRDFLLYLLTVDPQERPTAEAALQHPWLQHQYLAPPIQ